MRTRTVLALIGSLVLIGMPSTGVAAATTDPSSAGASSSIETVDASGIAIVGPKAIQVDPKTEAQAEAFDSALTLSMKNQDDMGYPWLDTTTGVVELRATDASGQTTARTGAATLSKAGSNVKVTEAPASIAALDRIATDVTKLSAAGVADPGVIWMTEPDQKNNRIIITVTTLDPDLMSSLAKRFGTERIAVRVLDAGPASTASRDSDAPAFWGGAKISTSTGKVCTTGFAWTNGSKSAMLTAAHCISTGGNVSYPAYSNVGTVTSGSRENWNDTNGTQYYTGQSTYRGDVALITYSSLASAGRVYSGAPHTSTNRAVSSMASRTSQFGDAACVNGITTGEWCGAVTGTGINILYLGDGPNVWARHMVRAESGGNTCPTHGDSGGPVYRKPTSTTVSAVGIMSGSLPLVLACATYFTDIWDAWYGLPGTLKTT